MARKSPYDSALSKPQNFIAESSLRRFYRKYRLILWSVVIVTVIGGGSAAFFTIGQRGLDARETKAPARRAPAPEARTARKPEMPPLWTAEDFKPAVNTANPAPERLTNLPPPALPEEAAAPAPLREVANAQDAQAHETTSNPEPATAAEVKETGSAVDPGGPKVADEAKPTDAAPQPTVTPRVAEEATGQAKVAEPTSPGPDMRAPGLAAAAPRSAVEKADQFLRRGQYSVARYLYEEAYKAGEISGALGMAKSYDAIYLKSIGLQAKGDAQKARVWYRRAAEMSSKRKEAP
jgi:hypothetical protein